MASENASPILAEELASSVLAQGLTSVQVSQLLGALSLRTYKAGEQILESGETTDALIVLLAGKAGVSGAFIDDINLIPAGGLLGEISFIDGKPRSASVVAEADCRCGLLPREVLEGWKSTHPDLVIALLWNLTQVLCGKMRTTSRLIDALSVTQV